MTESDNPEEQQRERRAKWPVVRRRLDDDFENDVASATTPEERIAMMWPLAVAAWTLAGRPLPTYGRENIPARLFRPGTPVPDEEA